MIYALVNNEITEAEPKLKGLCPCCGKPVIAHCGEIYQWHWKHKSGPSCDSWSESESVWHIEWKKHFKKENTEVRIGDERNWHVADIYTPEEVVIELQYSPITLSIIEQRESFYGKKMMWLLHKERLNFQIVDLDYINYNMPIPFNIYFNKEQWIIDLMGRTPTDKLLEIMTQLNFKYLKSGGYYYKWSTSKHLSLCLSNDITQSLKDELKLFSKELFRKESLKKFFFYSKQKTWMGSKRPIFIDSLGNDLYWIYDLRSNYGLLKVTKKATFIRKYTKEIIDEG